MTETPADPNWEAVDAGAPLRRYQARATKELLALLAPAGTRTCLVAPPGAGKTRCALHVAAALSQPLEVRVPTTALVHQWRERAARDLVALESGARPPVQVSTYAASRPFHPRALVVLDEAHHLGGAWGRAVEQSLTSANRVLGLTGTPLSPEDETRWERFVSLVGDQPVFIETPPLVRDGHLCPYHDLVWPVLAEIEDFPDLRRAHDALTEVERALESDLDTWEAHELREHLWELTEARFARREGLLVALCRRRNARGLPLPPDLPRAAEGGPDPEYLAPLTLADRALLLWSFAPEDARVRTALEQAGFRGRGATVVPVRDVAWASLSESRARIRGCMEALLVEDRARNEGLRALVLTDRDVEGDRVSARAVLRALVSDRRTDPLDPILVTGSVFWVDDDLWPRVAPHLPEEIPWTEVEGHHRVDVSSWSVAERVACVTRLLRAGVTRCLVGTHHLLGEGWDCPAINCVVDLTGIAASVTVNQVRGRALRLDPADPSKVASLWEVLVMVPGAPSGYRMLERFQERHRHTLGVDGEGRIRTGASRIDPLLGRSGPEVATALESLRTRMTARAGDPVTTARRWARGRDYADRRLWRVDPPATPAPRLPRETPVPDAPPVLRKGSWLQLRRRNRRREGTWVGLTATLPWLGGLGAATLVNPAVGAAAGLAVAAGCGLGWWSARRRSRSALSREHAALRALARALGDLPDQEGRLCREGTRAWWDGPAAASHRFAEAAAELLGPIRYPRYLLVESDGSVGSVPGVLGASRHLADTLAEAWQDEVGPCEVVYARQGRGRHLLVQAWRLPGRPGAEVVEEWE